MGVIEKNYTIRVKTQENDHYSNYRGWTQSGDSNVWCGYKSRENDTVTRTRDRSDWKRYVRAGYHGPESFIIFNIEDQIYRLPASLKHIYDEIIKSRKFLNLELDERVDFDLQFSLWKSAVNFLINYSIQINDTYDIIIEAPEINPCIDSTIDISWRSSKARLLLNFRKIDGQVIAFFYGDFYGQQNAIKGNVQTGIVEDYLASWMKNLI